MSDSPLQSVRKEVREYFSACEDLLAVAVTPKTPPFSKEELEMLEFYAAEIAEKIFLLQAQNK